MVDEQVAPKGKTDEEEGGEEESLVVNGEAAVAGLVAAGALGDVCILAHFLDVAANDLAVRVGGNR